MDPHQDYWKIAEIEQRFNTSETNVRALASTWMLAAFGAIAVLSQSKTDVTWLFNTQLLLVVVCAMASIGLCTLWILDQVVFHQLLNSAVLAALKLEDEIETLPPIRALMLEAAEGVGMAGKLMLFYLLPMLAFILFSACLTIISIDAYIPAAAHANEAATVAEAVNKVVPLIKDPRPYMIVLTLAQVLLICVMLGMSRKIAIRKRAALFDDPDFTALVKNEKFDSKPIIARFRPPGGRRSRAEASVDPAGEQ